MKSLIYTSFLKFFYTKRGKDGKEANGIWISLAGDWLDLLKLEKGDISSIKDIIYTEFKKVIEMLPNQKTLRWNIKTIIKRWTQRIL
jgi:hypothetical protein